ncbi:AAA family ATPase [Clostridium estertheticum]|uniref:AAA family ATPase n=1 Tax=Clostridium estertheticum TaxID=238834 RepID=UPI001C0DE190|nr:AAA family ATPase [Clostridium estertheticum]MBU3198157.1 AAA family ATPase [Clostridium estertheticum]WAG65948.1 AAA family ATPase [Clostridium estertheticum]
MSINSLTIEGFKSFQEPSEMNFSKINLFFGANSSGKSSAIQALMVLKQTSESKSSQYDLLTNGKYANLGNASDIINKNSNEAFSVKVAIGDLETNSNDINELSKEVKWSWKFSKSKNIINNIRLNNLEIQRDSNVDKFNYSEDKKIYINEDNNSAVKGIEISNIIPDSITLQYNIKYNVIMHGFLSDFYNIVNTDLKTSKWNKENAFQDESQRITKCFMAIMKTGQETKKETIINVTEGIKKFKKFCNAICIKMFIPHEKLLLWSIMELLIYTFTKNEMKKLNAIIGKYDIQLKQVDKINDGDFLKVSFKLGNSNMMLLSESDNELHNAKNNLQETLKKITYLGPIREIPKNMYEHDSDQSPIYVGKNGQYLPSILAYLPDWIVDSPLPNGEKVKDIKFIDALNKWMRYLGIADGIETSITNFLSINVNNEGVVSNIVNVGVGVSQVLPVISMGILSSKNDILIFEQPELHLHPYAQSKLIDFFIALSNEGRQIIVESHSEYFLHRLRYKILNNDIKKEDVCVLFFNKTSDGTVVKKAELGNMGNIEYPRGFKDTTEELIDEILKKQLERLKDE